MTLFILFGCEAALHVSFGSNVSKTSISLIASAAGCVYKNLSEFSPGFRLSAYIEALLRSFTREAALRVTVWFGMKVKNQAYNSYEAIAPNTSPHQL